MLQEQYVILQSAMTNVWTFLSVQQVSSSVVIIFLAKRQLKTNDSQAQK